MKTTFALLGTLLALSAFTARPAEARPAIPAIAALLERSADAWNHGDLDAFMTSYDVAVAHWHLAMKSGGHPTGIFSLVLHHSPGGWHIVADHSP